MQQAAAAAANGGGAVATNIGGANSDGTLQTQGGITGGSTQVAGNVSGSCTSASAIDATATGVCAQAKASGGTAYGSNAFASQSNATAVGFRASATGDSATSIGYANIASGVSAVAIGNANQVSGTQSIAIGYKNVVSGANSGAFGDPNVISGNSSYAVGNNNTIASNKVFVLGNNVNVAAGNDGAVVLGDGSTASGANTVSVGSAGQTRRITNVSDGIADTDAATVGQVNRATTALGNQIAGVQTQVYDLARSTSFGIAGATAIGMIPDIDPDQRFSIGGAVGGFDGYQAFAVGFTGRVSDNVKVRAAASISGGKSTYGAGVSFGW